MNKENCKNKAEVAIPWAGKIMKGCKLHAKRMRILGDVMGNPIECKELSPNNDMCEFKDDFDN